MEISSKRRNYMLQSHRRDRLIEWMREILNHGFVLDAPQTYADSFLFFEELIEEHIMKPTTSRLKSYVPSIGVIHTPLRLKDAWLKYDLKYAVSKRRHINPSFNELRHILNLAQVMSIGETLSLISFDGDQTLYTDGENFEKNEKLSSSIIHLLKAQVKVAIITAAGYGYDGAKYAIRLKGLLDSFLEYQLTSEEVSQFYVFGGECNFLLQAQLTLIEKEEEGEPTPTITLKPLRSWDSDIDIPAHMNPQLWDKDQIQLILDTAEKSMRATMDEMRLRAKVLRKERAVGMFPGGDEMSTVYPVGHGSHKLKAEALDEVVLRVIEELREIKSSISVPFCAFNGGRDAWVDIGNKGVAVGVLQHLLKLKPATCLHVGDQFLSAGNDIAARDTCPTIWITSPRETEKILEHVLKFKFGFHNNNNNNGDNNNSISNKNTKNGGNDGDNNHNAVITASMKNRLSLSDSEECIRTASSSSLSPMKIRIPQKNAFDIYGSESGAV